MATIYVM